MGTFKNYCTCGGYAWQMNGRPEAQPHMAWCPQREEYAAWYERRRFGVPPVSQHPVDVSLPHETQALTNRFEENIPTKYIG